MAMNIKARVSYSAYPNSITTADILASVALKLALIPSSQTTANTPRRVTALVRQVRTVTVTSAFATSPQTDVIGQ